MVREEEGGREDRLERRREGLRVRPGDAGEGADLDVERRLGGVLEGRPDFDGAGDGCEGFCLTCIGILDGKGMMRAWAGANAGNGLTEAESR